MIKSKKKDLIIILALVLLLLGVILAIKFSHHGTLADKRVDNSSFRLDKLSDYSENKVTIKDSFFYNDGNNSAGDTLNSYAVRLDDYASYQTFNRESGLDLSLTYDSFKSNSYLLVSREGSYYQLSEVKKFTYSADHYSLTYYFEDSQIVAGGVNKKDIFCFDLFKVSTDKTISYITIEDKTF